MRDIREVKLRETCSKHNFIVAIKNILNTITIDKIYFNAVTIVITSLISPEGCHRQLCRKKKNRKMGKELFSLSRPFRGSLILSDACFQHRASMTPSFPLFFHPLSSSFSLMASARGAFLVKISEFLRHGFCNRERRVRERREPSLSSSSSL